MTDEAVLLLIAGGVIAYLVLGPEIVDGESDNGADAIDYGNQALDLATELFEGQDDMSDKNKAAFLRCLRLGEGTSGPNGYNTLCGGALFSSFAQHPAEAGWRGLPLSDRVCSLAGFGPGCVSTAAGAYQFNKPTWRRVAAKIGATDFSPAWQDAAAWHVIGEKGAQADVLAGRIEQAISKVRKIWASLPGAGYGQREESLAAVLNEYKRAGGMLA